MAERLHHELPVGSHLPSSGDDHTAFEIWGNGACCETEGHQHFFFICNNRSQASGGSLNKMLAVLGVHRYFKPSHWLKCF